MDGGALPRAEPSGLSICEVRLSIGGVHISIGQLRTLFWSGQPAGQNGPDCLCYHSLIRHCLWSAIRHSTPCSTSMVLFLCRPIGSALVKFEVRSITPTREKPHGLDYSLTLHGPSGEWLVGFDNAHSVKASEGPGGKREVWDHKHRLRTIRPYDYSNAAALIEDFWKFVDDVLEERGVKR